MINFKQLGTNIMNNEKNSLYLNEVRKNLAASASCSCRRLKAPTFGALPPTIPVGDLGRFTLIREPLNFVPLVQYAG